MLTPPSRGWHKPIPAAKLTMIFLAGLTAMRFLPLAALPLVLGMIWVAPPFGHLRAKLTRNIYCFQPRRQLVSLGLLYLTALPILAAWQVLLQYLGIPFATQQPAVEMLQQASGWRLTVLLISITVLAPVLEEILFRRVLYDLLHRYCGVWGGIILTSAIFAAIHLFLLGFPMLMLCGVIFQLAYLRSRSLTAAIELHAVFNTIGVITALVTAP